jgi:hypothetical protein
MKALAKLPLLFQPGEKWQYGLNTDLLGCLIEVISGMTLDEFFRKNIFEPLGMKDTYFNVPKLKSIVLQRFIQKIHQIISSNGVTHFVILIRIILRWKKLIFQEVPA